MSRTVYSGIAAVKKMLELNLGWITFPDVLRSCFPCAFLNRNNEMIVDADANSYFSMDGVHNEIDLGVKILSGLSRDAYKTEPFERVSENLAFQFRIRSGINLYFGKQFTEDDLEIIYTYLGNGIRNDLARRFITEGNLDTEWLLEEVRKEKEARLKRDIAESVVEANMEAVNMIKLQLRIINDQIAREWGRNG